MAPRPRFGWRPGQVPDDCRHGGTLLLLYPLRGRPHLLLTVRDERMQNHAGQVSLPGGAAEPGESLEQAALRETHEEVGVDPRDVCLVGSLTELHVPVSRFVLHPRVGITTRRPEFRRKPDEVARILEVPLAELMNPARVRCEVWTRDWGEAEVPFFDLDGEKVWGATAMVLSEFLCVLGCPPDPGC